MFTDPLFILVLLACLAVVFVLARGISHFGKGDIESAKKSNKMMQWRLGLQFLAVVLLLFFLWMRSGG